MRNLIKSCLGQSSSIYKDVLEMMEVDADNYWKSYKVSGILSEQERKYFDYIMDCYARSNKTPTADLFCKMFPETISIQTDPSVVVISADDIMIYMRKLVALRVNAYASKRMEELNAKVAETGITDEISNEFERLRKLSGRNVSHDVELQLNGRANYQQLKERTSGLTTGIKEIDELIGGINEGTLTVIAGFTSHFKSTFALNIAYTNSYYGMFNVVFISLETPKNDMYWNLLSRHSYQPEFNKFQYISHEKMRRTTLTPDEEAYLFNVVEPALYSDVVIDGKPYPRGRVVILDESDFAAFTFNEISAVLEELDDKLPGGVHAVIVDYIQLCKFSGGGVISDETTQVNAYVSFFRRLSQNFKRYIDPNTGEERVKQLAVILLSQIRRDSWRRAVNHNGIYDITCLSDSSELEKSAFRILTTYTDEERKQRKIAQVQILKNRTGQTLINEPVEVYVDPEAYVFVGDEDGRLNDNILASGGSLADEMSNFDFGSGLDGLL